MRIREAWAWLKDRGAATLAVIGAFLGGLLVGGVLGWWGFGHRTISWGTAGEWAGAVGTAAALGAALGLFRLESARRVDEVQEREAERLEREAERQQREAERQERRQAQARLIHAGTPVRKSHGQTWLEIHNKSSEPVYNLIVASWADDIGYFDTARAMRVPPGSVELYTHVPEGATVGDVLQLRFGDTNGVRWVREFDGELREATDEERTQDQNPRWGI
jgi:hypothetical protein